MADDVCGHSRTRGELGIGGQGKDESDVWAVMGRYTTYGYCWNGEVTCRGILGDLRKKSRIIWERKFGEMDLGIRTFILWMNG